MSEFMLMSGEPPFAGEHASMAERFPSFGAYAAWTATVPQNATVSLDVARSHAFTGEVTFLTEPAVRLYLDGGTVYHAERNGDPTIGEGLLAAGVVDTMQLKRGMVRVGDVEHLGRLFERDASIDRDAVLVSMERSTMTIVQQLTSSIASAVTVNAYRHHPSGIHRWFVPQSNGPAASRPLSGVTQIDRSVVEDLPVLGGAQRPTMAIEWTEPDLTDDGRGVDTHTEIEQFDTDVADWTTPPSESAPEADSAPTVAGGAFRITWPDGTSDESIVPAVVDLSPEPAPATDPTPAVDDVPVPLTAPESVAPPLDSVFVDPPVLEVPPVPNPTVATPRVESAMPPALTFDTPPLMAPEPLPAAEPASPLATPIESVAPLAPAPEPVAPAPAPATPNAPEALSAPVTPSAPVMPSAPVTPSAPVMPEPVVEIPVPSTTVEPLRIDRIPQPDAAVPDDVAAAVRRALRAIEDASNRSAIPQPTRPMDRLPELTVPSFMEPTLDTTPVFAEPASLTPPSIDAPIVDTSIADSPMAQPPMAQPPVARPAAALFDGADGFEDPVVEDPVVEVPVVEVSSVAISATDPAAADPVALDSIVAPPSPAPPDPSAAPLSFAPPTNDMRAEAVYERAAAEVQAELDGAEATSPADLDDDSSADQPPHEPGKASVVFVEDEQVASGERRSALRRLIGSLRNKDD